MNFLKAMVFGVVEGVTEWIPVSSTAHIKIFNEILKFDVSKDFFSVFEVVIQFGAIVALTIVLWKKIWPFGENNVPLGKGILRYVNTNKFLLCLKLAVACLPVIIYKLFIEDFVHIINENNEMIFIGVALIVIGLVFVFVEMNIKHKNPCIVSTKDITFTHALIIGISQLIAAIFPGVSRSGITIIVSLLMSFSRPTATEFTFELSIPVMLGASFMEMLDFGFAFSFGEIILLLLSCAIAFVVSLYVIRFVLDYIKKNSFVIFGIYRIILGIIVIVFLS